MNTPESDQSPRSKRRRLHRRRAHILQPRRTSSSSAFAKIALQEQAAAGKLFLDDK